MTVQQLICLQHLTECKAKSKMFIRKLFLYSATLISKFSFISKCATNFNLKSIFCIFKRFGCFFYTIYKQAKVLDEFLQKRLPHVCPTRWNYAAGLVNTVHKKLHDLRLVFDSLLDNDIDIPSAALPPISGHLANLEDFNFCFCLAVFHKIYSLTDVLFSYLQKSSFDILSLG